MENLLDNALKKTKISQWMEERKQQKKNFAELQLKKEDFITDRLNKMDVLNRLKNAVTSVIPGNPLARDFDIHGQVASTGPGLLWKIFSAVKKSTKEEAAVFYFEKKVLDKYHKRDKEVIIESLRKGVQQLTKLRHPRILSVIHPLEETREALAFATEPVFSSLANVLGSCDNLSGGSKILSEFQLYEVEIKHGLLQILEGLGFLHNDAKMLHRNICPSSIVLAKFGTWKLAGCEFVQQAGDSQDQKAFFTCHEWRSDMPRDAQPNLDYMAPEYELNHTCSPASDMFSFGILMYALHNNGRPLYECEGELRTFRQNAEELGSMRNSLLSKMPSQLADHVKLLLNLEPTIRPDAAQMMKIPFFEDMACIALQYIDSLYQRENIEKSNFFKGLPKIIECLPKRVSQQRVLPALFKEGVNANMVPFILPSIFLISEQSTTEEYREMVLPELIPFFKIREPIQVMLMFLQNMNLLLSKTPAQQIQTYVFPLIFAALEADSPQIQSTDGVSMQELCLSIIPTFADLIEYTTLKKSMIPRIKKLCLGTSVLNVRVNCLLCIGKLMDQMDKWFVLDEILPFLREIPSREPAVLMSILGIHKVALSEPKLGITKDVMANKVLPFLIPLCIDNNLNLNQFNAYMGVVKEMLSKVETEHRTKLEQLDQIQQEHKTLEISKIVGENGSFGKQGEGKTFMDKFWSGIGFGGGGGGESMKVNASSTPEVNSGVNVTPKKTTLSLEEKQKLAKQQEQEKALKSQPPLDPQSKTPSTSKPSSVTPSSGPRDLTSTLMESNMRNLSMSSKSSSGSNIGSPAGTPMSTSGGANWPGATGMGGGVNWASASSTNSHYMTPQPSLSSSNTSFPSAEKPKVDLSSFDTLLTTPSSAKKVPVNQMGQTTGMWTASQPGMTPRPSLGMTGAGGISNSQGWGQNTMPSYQQPTFGAFTASPSTNQSWGGSGIRPMSGVMQPMQASQQNSAANKSLTSDDLKDLLG
ncbi:SCY1-like protein 2 isoform X1 [Biomphalaria glabrata]|uniref:SCY1-like protein 2 isoform X1 n=2 Tax=Biomphalaria glabrata TaxID=6526 RepID=A0A9W3BJ23_BIOGL|nr:SCY1-like protein 2 isoform X1 [Biomphalaria glabrata]